MTKTKIIKTLCNELSIKTNKIITAEVTSNEKTRYMFFINDTITTVSVDTEFISDKKREMKGVIDTILGYLEIIIKAPLSN